MSPPKIPQELIDEHTFNEILEMDDDEDREFSNSVALSFLEQAEEAFAAIENSLYKLLQSFNLSNVVLILFSQSQE